MKHFLYFFLLTTTLQAAPIGNPASPDILQQGMFIADTAWCQLRASFQGDFITNDCLSCFASPCAVQKTMMKGNAQLGTLTWSIRERFDASIVLGSSSNEFRLYEGAQLNEFQTSGGLIWYGEGKLILLEMKDTVFSVFGEAGGWEWMKGPYFVDDAPQGPDAHLKMRFWQAGAAFTQRLGVFSPYIGIASLHSKWKISTPLHTTFRFSQEHTVGPFLGCSLSNSTKVSLNIEWRGWFENGLTASGEIRF